MRTHPPDNIARPDETARLDEEAEAIAAERIRTGAAAHEEDGAKALERLGIVVPLQRPVPNGEIVVPVEAALDLAPQKGKRRGR
jgi:hypothetical protein